MQKIGLVSYQFWYNYGTCLQAYALWKKIQMMGFDSEYINFGWHYPISESKVTLLSKIKYKVKHILNLDKIETKVFNINAANNRLFDEFRNDYIKESSPIDIHNLESIESSYSKFIVGSDQTSSFCHLFMILQKKMLMLQVLVETMFRHTAWICLSSTLMVSHILVVEKNLAVKF